MAENATTVPEVDSRPNTLAVYRTILASRIRAQAQYRLSFGLDAVASMGFALVELLEVYVVFHNVDVLGGLDFKAALLLFGFARTGFAIADTLVGHLDQLGSYIRLGRLDVLLVRPASVLGQFVTLDFHPRRIGAVITSLTVLVTALAINDIAWSPAMAVLVVGACLASALIFSALWIMAGALQLWLTDASDAVNTFTAGGGYAADYPTSIFPRGVRAFLTFVIPAAFAGYLPTLVLLDLPGPPGLPQWLGWFAPVVGSLFLGLSVVLWRRGLHHYSGAGG